MTQAYHLMTDERNEIEALIKSFDNHGCGFGLDLKAQVALRRLLDALDDAGRTIEKYQTMASQYKPQWLPPSAGRNFNSIACAREKKGQEKTWTTSILSWIKASTLRR